MNDGTFTLSKVIVDNPFLNRGKRQVKIKEIGTKTMMIPTHV